MKNYIDDRLNLILDNGSRIIIDRLKAKGFEAFVVGGAVRDALLGIEIHDRDITSSASPEAVIDVFKDFPVFLTGVRFKTVTVVIDNKNYEITSFRAETDYLDGRHPSSVVRAKTLEEDLSRRDFTINAMAYNAERGLVDLFGGVNDLEKSLIRTVGNANERMNEDYLRILRALRFASKFDFEIEDSTKEAILQLGDKLKFLSVERIYAELSKLLEGIASSKLLEEFSSILFQVIPELQPCCGFEQKSLSHSYDVFKHTLVALKIAGERVRGLNDSDKQIVLWTVLLHDVGKPQCFIIDKDNFGHFPEHWVKSSIMSKEILTRLKAPKHIINNVSELCLCHDTSFATKYHLKCFLNKYGREFFERLLQVKYADLNAHSQYGINRILKHYNPMLEFYKEIISNDECYSLKKLKFKGSDAIALGFEGKQISQLLNEVLDLVFKGEIENKKEIIINYVKHNNP